MSKLKPPTVWLIDDNKVFKEYERSDPRLDWKWAYTPSGMVRLKKPGKDRWEYRVVGVTREDAADRFNEHWLRGIAEHLARIVELRARMVTP